MLPLTASQVQLVRTSDGSDTLFRPDINETYHSLHGAVQEALWVYITNGYLDAQAHWAEENTLRILEIGFGTGLNACLTALKAAETERKTEMYSLEPYPLVTEIWQKLNYTALPSLQKDTYLHIQQGPWGELFQVNPYFSLCKWHVSIEDFQFQPQFFNLVYFDAFAPNKQPEVWATENIAKCAALLQPGGTLVTYSARGDLKRSFKATGFKLERLKGAPGKWEMFRGRLPKG